MFKYRIKANKIQCPNKKSKLWKKSTKNMNC